MVKVSGTEPKTFGWIEHFRSTNVMASSVNGGRVVRRRKFKLGFAGSSRLRFGQRVNVTFGDPRGFFASFSEGEKERFGFNIEI